MSNEPQLIVSLSNGSSYRNKAALIFIQHNLINMKSISKTDKHSYFLAQMLYHTLTIKLKNLFKLATAYANCFKEHKKGNSNSFLLQKQTKTFSSFSYMQNYNEIKIMLQQCKTISLSFDPFY